MTITGTLTNETAHQQLGSANLFWPSGFDVTAASVSPGSASVAASCSLNGFAAGPCVQLRALSLAPGESATATMTVKTPSPCASYTWQIEAKQANSFSGTPGNDLDLDSANSSLTTQVTSPCATSVAFDTQPHNAFVGEHITGRYGIDRQEAYALCSVACDLRIHELVDAPNWVVGAFLPEDVFDGDRGSGAAGA